MEDKTSIDMIILIEDICDLLKKYPVGDKKIIAILNEVKAQHNEGLFFKELMYIAYHTDGWYFQEILSLVNNLGLTLKITI